RFWRLIQSNRAPKFDVNRDYALQLLHDWIAGDWLAEQQLRITGRGGSRAQQHPQVEASHRNAEVALQKTLAPRPEAQSTRHLIELMAPARHFTPQGLAATRLFSRRLS